MRVRLIAVGTRLPAWARSACDDYLERLAPQLAVTVQEIAPGTRSKGGSVGRAVATEGQRLLAALRASDHVVALDERGQELTTRGLAAWLRQRMHEGRNLTFVIGGPDGLADAVRARADSTLSLSRLTLPHALARVVLAEQLYRAASLLGNHPYHRE
jgi:23S rRNA (pseudouridine1915-N3)-methyltransferase